MSECASAFCSLLRRLGSSDALRCAEEGMRFNDETADLYLPFQNGMGPAYNETVSACVLAKPDAETILDLCSGLGEPACSLARAFPRARVMCSDASAAMVERTMKLAQKKGLRLDGTVMEINDLSPIESSSQDVVTCNFGLMYTVDHAKVLSEVMRVLKPNGFFIGCVWHSFSLVPLVTVTMGEVIQKLNPTPQPLPPPGEPRIAKDPPPLNVRLGPPIDPLALADAGALDGKLKAAGFVPMEGHNTLGTLKIDLGQAFGKKTWKVGCTPVLATIRTMHEEQQKIPKKKKRVDIQKIAKAAFDKVRYMAVTCCHLLLHAVTCSTRPTPTSTRCVTCCYILLPTVTCSTRPTPLSTWCVHASVRPCVCVREGVAWRCACVGWVVTRCQGGGRCASGLRTMLRAGAWSPRNWQGWAQRAAASGSERQRV